MRTYTVFAGTNFLVQGTLREVAVELKRRPRASLSGQVLIFDDVTGKVIDLDLRGSVATIVRRLEKPESDEVTDPPASPGPGRPRLGVVSREVTLLPRHWEWLADQPGGASVTLRKLVDDARRKNQARDRVRTAQEAAYRFMHALAGNLSNFEEGIRSLYANDRAAFQKWIRTWPRDVRDHAARLADRAFGA